MKCNNLIYLFFLAFVFISCHRNDEKKVSNFLTEGDRKFWEAKKYDSSWDRGYRLFYYFDRNGKFFYFKKEPDGKFIKPDGDVQYYPTYEVISDSVISIFGGALYWIKIDYDNQSFKIYSYLNNDSKTFIEPSTNDVKELEKLLENER